MDILTKEEKIRNLIVAYDAVVETLHLEGYSWNQCVKRTNEMLQ